MNVHFADWGNDAPHDERKQQPHIGLDVIDVGDWDGQPVPERRWVVPDWILLHAVTLISGAGGTGKSLLVQQWLSAISRGDLFMGVRGTAPVPVLYLNCEDDIEELHRRQVAIAKACGRKLSSYKGHVHLVARIGMDNRLGVIGADGRFGPSAFFGEIRDVALQIGAKVIALDNAMQLFVGNLNDPREVTVFCNALSRLALDTGAAVILAGHVAKVAGSEFAGTMAWENAVRMRLFLKRETDEDGAEIEDSDRRILTRGKANSARKGERLSMIWLEGAIYNEGDIAGTDGRLMVEETAFLRCLDAATAQRRNVSHVPGKNWAPAVFASMPKAGGVGKKAMEQAMERLLNDGTIVANQELWRHERRRAPVLGIARKTPAQPPHNLRAQPLHILRIWKAGPWMPQPSPIGIVTARSSRCPTQTDTGADTLPNCTWCRTGRPMATILTASRSRGCSPSTRRRRPNAQARKEVSHCSHRRALEIAPCRRKSCNRAGNRYVPAKARAGHGGL